MVEVFLSMGFLVIIFQTGAVMLHFQETWLFWELGIPTPNFRTESLLHPISNSNTVPGCLLFAVSVPSVRFFSSPPVFSVLISPELACLCGLVCSAECWFLEKLQFSPFRKGKAATAPVSSTDQRHYEN